MSNTKETNDNYTRRDFVRIGAAAGLGAAFGGMVLSNCSAENRPTSMPVDFLSPKIDPVRIGFVGVGGMGTAHVRNFIRIEGVEIKAICDIVEDHAKRSQKMVVDAGQPEPDIYTRDEYDFKRMCERDDLDLVFTATPWKWHVPVCVEAMTTGKHAATEVPAAYTIDDCWQLVETSENTQKYCIMMENCCYGRREMMLLNMVRKGMFGDLMHGECGYLHDLRGVKFSENGEGLWRREHAKTRNGNFYPTHGLGPVAQRMNINRGDAFEYLVSMSTPSKGLQLYAEENYPAGHPKRQEKYVLGDVNVCMIQTVNGKSITLYHDCNLPRPYSRGDLIQGTKGIAHGYPDRIYVEGVSENPHQWEELDKYRDQYEHPLWTEQGERARGAGHGGMDFIEDYRLIYSLRNGERTDLDVYDAAAWSVICELSEISVANKSKAMDFPDFTRGLWKTREPLGIVGA